MNMLPTEYYQLKIKMVREQGKLVPISLETIKERSVLLGLKTVNDKVCMDLYRFWVGSHLITLI